MSGGGGADSGQAANPKGGGGWLSGLADLEFPWSGGGDPGALLSGGVAPVTGSGPISVPSGEGVTGWVSNIAGGIGERMAGDLPGYGALWSIGADGVQITDQGKLVIWGVALVGAFLLFGGSGKRGRW